MGVQPVFPNDGGGELKVLPGVEGFFLGIDAFRGDAHGDQLPGGAAGLGKGLAVSVQPAGSNAHGVGMSGQIVVGSFDPTLQHQAGFAVIDLTAQQHHGVGRVVRLRTISSGKAHGGQHYRRHDRYDADAGDQYGLQPFGEAAEQLGEKTVQRRQQQQRRRPEHADVAHADGQRQKKVYDSQQGESAEDR